MIEKVHKAL